MLLIGCLGYATSKDTTKTSITKKPVTETKATPKPPASSPKVKNNETTITNRQSLPVTETTIITVCVSFFIIMLVLILLFFKYVFKKEIYLGFHSIKFIGLVIIFPGICIIALVGGDLIQGSTLAALLGTIAGYVLSKEEDSVNDALKKENEVLKAKVKELEAVVPIINNPLNK